MAARQLESRWKRTLLGVAAPLVAVAVGAAPALAAVPLTKIGTDPFTNTTSQHQTQVEPDTFSSGSTIVALAQSGRFFNGGSSGIAFATSQDNGSTWTQGVLPHLTVHNGGTWARASDPAIAFDARHNVWLASTLPLRDTPSVDGTGVMVSRSLDGGLTWSDPIMVVNQVGADKNWIVCDNTASSPFYGNCYSTWDDFSRSDLLQNSTSTDGGLTWGPPLGTTSGQIGIGGQPVVQPNGTVVVPLASASESAIGAYRSTNGGASWTDVTTIALTRHHTVAGGLREGPLPSAEIDASGKVYVAWTDCRFRNGCKANDIIMSTSTNGVNWTALQRIPIDGTNSGVDHFIPGLAVDKATSGTTAHLALTYYFYPVARCSSTTCQLNVGFISSTTGGSSWGSAITLNATPMSLSWIADTSQGRMVGDYISTSFAGGLAHGVFSLANAPSGGVFDQGTYTNTGGLALGGSLVGETTGLGNVPPGIYTNNSNAHVSWH